MTPAGPGQVHSSPALVAANDNTIRIAAS